MGKNRNILSTFSKSSVLIPLAVITGLVILGAVWKIPQWQVTSLQRQIDTLQHTPTPTPTSAIDLKDLITLEKGRIDAENAARTALIQGLGGIFFFVTAYLSYRTLKATEEKQITERYSKSIEQLGDDKIEVRLGGIYALERIVKDSPKDHWTIMEVLTSFVQEKSPLQQNNSRQAQEPKTQENVLIIIGQHHSTHQEDKPQKITTDVQAVLTVIGRRDSTKDSKDKCLDLGATNLRNAFLDRASLSGADLSRADLSGASLSGTNLSSAFLNRANLSGASLSGVMRISVVNQKIHRIPCADLSGASLWKANLRYADLCGAILLQADLCEADLRYADLCGANLSEAGLRYADLCGAILLQADLGGADLGGADLSEADLSGADLDGADFSGVKGLTPEKVRSAKNWEQATYDDDFRKALGLLPEATP